ncbi:hypothetical protein [Longimicrobium sp.]|nr:hypothetical protein [Longimicrobium sp.]
MSKTNRKVLTQSRRGAEYFVPEMKYSASSAALREKKQFAVGVLGR